MAATFTRRADKCLPRSSGPGTAPASIRLVSAWLNSSCAHPLVNCLCQRLLAEAAFSINQSQWPVRMKDSSPASRSKGQQGLSAPYLPRRSYSDTHTPHLEASCLPHPNPPQTWPCCVAPRDQGRVSCLTKCRESIPVYYQIDHLLIVRKTAFSFFSVLVY